MNYYLKKIPITTFILIYLYLCGGLFLIAYWSTFDLDISNIVNITEIPKSFIFPFILSNLFFILYGFAGEITGKPTTVVPTKVVKYSLKHYIIDTVLFSGTLVIIYYYYIHKYSITYWIIACIFFILLFAYKFGNSQILNKLIPNHNLKYYLFSIIITVPIFCVLTAKVSSLSIYNNDKLTLVYPSDFNSDKHIQYSDSLKLLGFLGDKVIASTLNNSNIFIINQSSVNSIRLSKKVELNNIN